MTVDSATFTARPDARRRKRRHLEGHKLPLAAMTAGMAVVYSVFSLTLQRNLTSTSYDLVIFDQAVRSYAHFEPGISIIKGYHDGFGPGFSVLGDHWSPILASLAPLYWIYNGPQTLIVAQAVLLALAVPPLWAFTRRAFGGGRKAVAAAYFVSAAYALSWPIVEAANFDFHEAAFAPVLTAVALERLQAGRLRTSLAALGCLLLVKEDMGLFVAGIGIALMVSRAPTAPRQRLVGLGLAVAGLLDTVVAVYVLIPAFGGRSDYYWAYDELGRNLSQAVQHIILHPVSSLHVLVTPGAKVDTMLWLLAPFLFLPLLSPLSIAAIPLLLERMFNETYPAWWGLAGHYNSYLVIVLACAAVDGTVRLERWVALARARKDPGVAAAQEGTANARKTALASSAAMLVIAIALVPRFPLGAVFTPQFYHRTPAETAGSAAAAAVPSGVTVEAMNHIGPQLTSRDAVLLWDTAHSPLYPPWVVASLTRPEFSIPSMALQVRRVRMLKQHGYKVVFDSDGWIVLRGPNAGSSSMAAGRSA